MTKTRLTQMSIMFKFNVPISLANFTVFQKF